MNDKQDHVTLESLLPLHQREIDLLFIIRKKYQFGRLEIVCENGIPGDVLKTIERTRLGNLSPTQFDENHDSLIM